MADANIGGNLPVGDKNGLSAIAAELVAEPDRMHVMLAVIDTQKVTRKTDTGEQIATVRIRRIERVLGQDLATAEKLIRRALEHRTGMTVLPLDVEDDMRSAFENFDATKPEGDGHDDDGGADGGAE
jgi:hypothetical protein